MLLDVRPDHLKIVQDILQRFVPDREVCAFGSRAKWLAKEYSDLDLCVLGETPLGFQTLGLLDEAFDESDLPYKVDIVDWVTTSESFRKIIERDKVLVQKGKAGAVSLAPTFENNSADWRVIALGDFVALQRGHDLPDQSRRPGPVPILGSFGITGYHDTAKSKGPGVTIGRSGASFGVAAYTDQDYWPLNTALYVTDFKGNDPKFVFYFFKQFDFSAYNSGSAQPSLNRNNLYGIPIQVPIPSVQKAISSMLSALDDRIALLRQTNDTLEAIAQALFKSWFVDFDPVRAKAEGREPEGVPPEVAELFPSEFEESELGDIPKGWKAEPFGKLLGHAIGGDWGKDDADDEHPTAVAIVRGTDVPDIKVGNLDGVPRRFVSPKKLKSRRLQDGDLIIEVSGGSKTQATGRSLYCTDGLLDDFGMPVVPASFCRLFRPADKYLGVLLAIHLSSIYAAGKMWNYQVQSTGLANFQTTHFLESELVVVPSEPVREAFFNYVRPLIERQQTADIRTTASLRDTLLPRMMSGQLNPVEADS